MHGFTRTLMGVKAGTPKIQLRTAEFDRWAAAKFGATTNQALAEQLGENVTLLSLYRSGRRACGGAFIARVMAAAGPKRFGELFRVVES